MRNYTLILVGITLLLVGVFLYLYVEASYKSYTRHQEALMQQSTKGAASIIALYIRNAKRSVGLFAEEESELIELVASNPENDDMLQLLRHKVQRSFPEYFAFTITDNAGNVLLDDFEGKVGQECRLEIQRFIDKSRQDVSVHPNPLGYHYDIMAAWHTEGGGAGVFFISFRPEILARILSNSELHDHELVLVNRGRPALIEITARGVRSELERDIQLTEAERARISHATDIPGTFWTLVDLPGVGLFDRHGNKLLSQAGYTFLVFLLFSALMYWLIRREERQRTAAEQALRESRDHLEGRVGERTRALSDANAQLELEISERQRAEQALKHEISERVQTENALRTLHKITAAQDQPFDSRLRALLEHGCQQFKLPIGILSHIHGETYEVIQAVSPDDTIKAGTSLELGRTYCRETMNSDGPIGFEQAQGSEWQTHPCYQEYKLEAYFGIALIVGGEPYGTLNFSSPEPRHLCFTPTDEEVLRLMAQWVGGEIDRRRALEALKKSEESVRLLLQSTGEGIYGVDLDGTCTFCNAASLSILGYKDATEIVGKQIDELIRRPPADRPTRARRRLGTETDSQNAEVTDANNQLLWRADGSSFEAEYHSYPMIRDGKPVGAVVSFTDISERKRTETMFRLVVESAPNAIVMANSEGRITLVNSQTEKFFEYTRQELIGQPIEMLIPERYRQRHPQYRRSFATERRARAMGIGRDLSGRRKDGSEFPVEIGLSPIETEQGTLVLGAIVDISDRMRVNRELRRMRTYLKNIIDSMPSVLVGVDATGRVTEWNQEAEEATGVSANEAAGQLFVELFPEFEHQQENIREAILRQIPVRTERLSIEKNGQTRYLDIVVYPLKADEVTGAVIRVDDITQRARLEQTMVQTEKMLSVGGLAAGMAHEINNPLSGVLQSCQNIQRRLSTDMPANRALAESIGLDMSLVQQYLEERGILSFVSAIQQAASRASRIVADMLAFSRSSNVEFQPTRMEEILETVVRLAASDYDLKKKYDFKQVEIVRDYDSDVDEVVCDRTEIEQVFLNLIKNAAQAMAGESGSSPHRIVLRTRADGYYVRVEVEDNGPGMDSQVRRRVFEPFFTTKTVGVGTGLGLSVSYFIVTEQHKGTLEVQSTPGEGARFIVRLPIQGE